MRINVYLRGIDLIDVEFHAGSKGLYLDLNVFQPRKDDPEAETQEIPLERHADLSGTARLDSERVGGPVWADDQPALVRKVGF